MIIIINSFLNYKLKILIKNLICSIEQSQSKIRINYYLLPFHIFTLLTQQFESLLDEELNQINDLSKVWLCGPPVMC
jgi:hypothetical protein